MQGLTTLKRVGDCTIEPGGKKVLILSYEKYIFFREIRIKFTGNVLNDFMANILSQAVTSFLWPIFRIFISGWIQNGVIAVLASLNESLIGIRV